MFVFNEALSLMRELLGHEKTIRLLVPNIISEIVYDMTCIFFMLLAFLF